MVFFIMNKVKDENKTKMKSIKELKELLQNIDKYEILIIFYKTVGVGA